MQQSTDVLTNRLHAFKLIHSDEDPVTYHGMSSDLRGNEVCLKPSAQLCEGFQYRPDV